LLSSCVQKLTRHFSNFSFYFLIKLTPPRLPQKSWEWTSFRCCLLVPNSTE